MRHLITLISTKHKSLKQMAREAVGAVNKYKKASNKGFAPIVILLIVLFGIGVTILLYKNYQSKPESNPTPAITVLPTASPKLKEIRY